MLGSASTRPLKALSRTLQSGKVGLVPACITLNEQNAHTAFGTRAFASQQALAEPPVLKKVLRELYKRIHPDLFHDVPHAREANEHSFKLLQVHLRPQKSYHCPIHISLAPHPACNCSVCMPYTDEENEL